VSSFRPRLEILPAEQRQLWPSLAELAENRFVLYGGTAIALRFGHRVSVDFDFFSHRPLDRAALVRSIPWLATAEVLQDQPDTLTVLTIPAGGQAPVKVSLFGGLRIGRLVAPDPTSDGVALVASPLDLLATKLKVLLQRAERKDYEDVAILLSAGLSLIDGLAAARALYGPAFQVSESLKALVYFNDGDLPELASEVRRNLERAVLRVEAIPNLQRMTMDLDATDPSL
jgi:hypothetical protein